MSFRRISLLALLTVSITLFACSDDHHAPEVNNQETPEAQSLRVASFNTSLYRGEEGGLIADLSDPESEQPRQIAEIIQVVRPDVLLINELDYDEEGEAIDLFGDDFLGVPQGDEEALDYPYRYAFPSNTGIASGFDLSGDGSDGGEVGTEEYAQNAFGYGLFPGQYAFGIVSKYPLDTDALRTFQQFLWSDMPDNMMPEDFYSPEAEEALRLSSKNHVDLPVEIGDHRLHLLASHPTPPAFDGDEERNLRRNNDEIRFWIDYIGSGNSDYIYDDDGLGGGLDEDAAFVIVGDLNNDPFDGDGTDIPYDLVNDERIADPEQGSDGGEYAGENDGGINDIHEGPHRHITSDWNPQGPGNLRVDYALPSSNLRIDGGEVFWPAPDEPYADLVEATDHRLVWVDVTIGADDDPIASN